MEHGRKREGYCTEPHSCTSPLPTCAPRSRTIRVPSLPLPQHRVTWCSAFCREKDNHSDALDDVNMTDGGRKKRRMGCDGRTKRERAKVWSSEWSGVSAPLSLHWKKEPAATVSARSLSLRRSAFTRNVYASFEIRSWGRATFWAWAERERERAGAIQTPVSPTGEG